MAAQSKPVDISHAMVTEPVATGDWLVILPIIVTLLGGALCLMLRKRVDMQPRLGIVFLGFLVLADIGLLIRIVETGPITMVMGRWLPPFGIAFSVDIVGASLTLVSGIVAFLAAIYAIVDIEASSRRYGFYPFLLLLMTGVSGAFLTGDIFNLYVWFEVLLIASFGMIILGSTKRQFDGAIRYTFLNLVATTLFLVATGYLYGVLGTLNMADVALKVKEVGPTAPIGTIAALYLLAFAMKAAAFPLNFWLPASYHTPNIVVSAVFGGLLTKVGVYALIRTLVMLLPDYRLAMADVVLWLAAITMLAGALGALAQTDIRRLTGYLVISGIGSMLVGVALGTSLALSGSILYAIHSIIVMTALYLVVGIMGRLCQAYDLPGIGGLYTRDPLLSGMFLVLALAVSGLPPFSGFWPKVMLVDASLNSGQGWLAAAILVTGLLTTMAVGRVWLHGFWRGGPQGVPDGTVRPLTATLDRSERTAMVLPVLGLIAVVVIIGLWPNPFIAAAGIGAEGMIDPAAYIGSVFGGAP